jgi:hypothetical protein
LPSLHTPEPPGGSRLTVSTPLGCGSWATRKVTMPPERCGQQPECAPRHADDTPNSPMITFDWLITGRSHQQRSDAAGLGPSRARGKVLIRGRGTRRIPEHRGYARLRCSVPPKKLVAGSGPAARCSLLTLRWRRESRANPSLKWGSRAWELRHDSERFMDDHRSRKRLFRARKRRNFSLCPFAASPAISILSC